MIALRRISDWFKYERLHHYPALAALDRDAALELVEAYEREEREACQPWLSITRVLTCVLFILFIAMAYLNPIAGGLMIVVQMPGFVLQFALYRRIRRRVEVKVAAELGDGTGPCGAACGGGITPRTADA